eukprot:TRINITY_DN22_c0_g1_i6.p1 TRINITY_DN22_c0_g1~~TRINITY_DN22_c0_g1_i6.p1  ORF type:complete len:459 (-),score=144.78 TRINITY_DN22_c0_g1_i6:223-1599(-)
MTISRTEKSNAMNSHMLRFFRRQLKLWDHSRKVRWMMVRGGGNDFCGDQDLREVYDAKARGDYAWIKKYLSDQYQITYDLANFRTPCMIFWHGKVLGAGLASTLYSNYRIASGCAVEFSQAKMGWILDGGASYVLSRLPSYAGFYIALTGLPIYDQDLLYSGLATHYGHWNKAEELAQELHETAEFDDQIAPLIERYYVSASSAATNSELFNNRQVIRDCFSAPSVEEIMAKLLEVNTEFSRKCLDAMASAHPLSLKLTHYLLNVARNFKLETCMKLEYRAMARLMKRDDYFESIRARYIDRDNKPDWTIKSLQDVTQSMVEDTFHPIREELAVLRDPYAEVLNEYKSLHEAFMDDTTTFVAGVPVPRDWTMVSYDMPQKQESGTPHRNHLGWHTIGNKMIDAEQDAMRELLEIPNKKTPLEEMIAGSLLPAHRLNKKDPIANFAKAVLRQPIKSESE